MNINTVTIHIRSTAPGTYLAHATYAGTQYKPAESYDRIEDAIQAEACNIPDGFAHFLVFTYGGMSTGTVTIAEAIAQSATLADRLVELVTEEHEIVGRTEPTA